MTRFFSVCAALTFALGLAACGDSGGGTDSGASASSDAESGENGDDFFFCAGGGRDCSGGRLCVQHLTCDDEVTSSSCEMFPECGDMSDEDCWGPLFCEAGSEQVEVINGYGTTMYCRPMMCEAGTDSGETDSGETDSGETDSGETETGTAGP